MTLLQRLEIIFLGLLILSCALAGERFALGFSLILWAGFAAMRLLWIIEAGSTKRKGPRYLPAMILGRKLQKDETQDHARYQNALCPSMLLWLAAGVIYAALPVMTALLYHNDVLNGAQQFLSMHYDISWQVKAAMLDLSIQQAAQILLAGAAAWLAYTLGAAQHHSKLFLPLLAVIFAITLLPMHEISLPLSAPIWSLALFLAVPLMAIPAFRLLRDMLRYTHRQPYGVTGLIALGLVSFAFLANIQSPALYLSGWALMGYLWARTSAPPPKKLRIHR